MEYVSLEELVAMSDKLEKNPEKFLRKGLRKNDRSFWANTQEGTFEISGTELSFIPGVSMNRRVKAVIGDQKILRVKTQDKTYTVDANVVGIDVVRHGLKVLGVNL